MGSTSSIPKQLRKKDSKGQSSPWVLSCGTKKDWVTVVVPGASEHLLVRGPMEMRFVTCEAFQDITATRQSGTLLNWVPCMINGKNSTEMCLAYAVAVYTLEKANDHDGEEEAPISTAIDVIFCRNNNAMHLLKEVQIEMPEVFLTPMNDQEKEKELSVSDTSSPPASDFAQCGYDSLEHGEEHRIHANRNRNGNNGNGGAAPNPLRRRQRVRPEALHDFQEVSSETTTETIGENVNIQDITAAATTTTTSTRSRNGWNSNATATGTATASTAASRSRTQRIPQPPPAPTTTATGTTPTTLAARISRPRNSRASSVDQETTVTSDDSLDSSVNSSSTGNDLSAAMRVLQRCFGQPDQPRLSGGISVGGSTHAFSDRPTLARFAGSALFDSPAFPPAAYVPSR